MPGFLQGKSLDKGHFVKRIDLLASFKVPSTLRKLLNPVECTSAPIHVTTLSSSTCRCRFCTFTTDEIAGTLGKWLCSIESTSTSIEVATLMGATGGIGRGALTPDEIARALGIWYQAAELAGTVVEVA